VNTKRLSLIIIFIALTLALNVAGPKIPAPYAPFLFYQIWEIPIVIAFLVIGPKEGVIIAVINALVLLVVFPGALLLGPIYNLIAVLSMLLGVYIPYRIVIRGCKTENISQFLREHLEMIAISATALGIVLRVAVLSVVNYFALQQGPPVGFSLSSQVALAYLPLIGVFNATVALYTVPIGVGIAAVILYRFKL
jgi:riboflavin transporter FmnP